MSDKIKKIEGERWKDLVGYEGLYQISDHWRIKSYARYKGCIWFDEMILNIHDNGHGYMYIDLYKDKKKKKKYVHRLVAQAFLDSFDEDLVINHIDFDSKNNHYLNLECVTQKQNVRYSIKAGRYDNVIPMRGSQIGSSKLSEEKVVIIRDRFSKGENPKVIADDYNVHWSTIYKIVNREQWKHV